MKLLAMFIASLLVLAATAAYAQPFYGDPYDGARAAQWQYGAPNVYRRGPPPLSAYAAAPPAYAPAALPPAPPLGWIYAPFTVCTDPPACTAIVVSVGADGLNVRTVPNGPAVAALANGTPIIPVGREGDWILVGVPCLLMPTWTFSVTAGGVPLSVCL